MTGLEMITEMKEKGYKSHESAEWFVENYDDATIKRFYDKFMEYLKERG